jgi:hypothetical protein
LRVVIQVRYPFSDHITLILVSTLENQLKHILNIKVTGIDARTGSLNRPHSFVSRISWDISLIPQRRADGWGKPWPVVQSLHVYCKYDIIQQWAYSMQPSVMGLLTHPKLRKAITGHLNAFCLE